MTTFPTSRRLIAALLLVAAALGKSKTLGPCPQGEFASCPLYAVGYSKFCYASMDKDPASDWPPYSTGVPTRCRHPYITMPEGWELVPYNDAVITNVVALHAFGTGCLVFAEGMAYRGAAAPFGTSPGTKCGEDGKNFLSTSGNTHKVVDSVCDFKVLMRTTPCQGCPPGKWSDQTGITSDAQCQGCSPGKWSDQTRLTSDAQCQGCSPGKWSDQTGLASDAQCQGCSPGKWSDQTGLTSGAQCQGCSPGKWSDQTGLTSDAQCQACEAGKSSNLTGQPVQAACQSCLPGQFAKASGQARCTLCKPGEYRGSSDVSTTSCLACPEGRYQTERGQSACLMCAKGEVQNQTNETSCEQCKPNFFANETGMSACHRCPIGQLAGPGSQSCSNCGAGTFGLRFGECNDCTAGRYRVNHKDPDKNNPKICDKCPKGYYQKLEGQASCLPCLPGEFGNETGLQTCHKCAIGKKSEGQNATTCSVCADGQYSDSKGNGKCERVPPGYYSTADGIAMPCELDFVCEGQRNKPTPVQNGYIVLSGGVASVKVPLGSYIHCKDPTAANDGTPCDEWTFSPCREGTYGFDPPQKNPCKNCSAGKTSFGSATKCTPCSKGKFAQSEGTVCANCPRGYFQPQYEQPSTQCFKCPAGFDQPQEGEASCVDLGLNLITSCPDSDSYLNDTSADPRDYKCEICPPGAACTSDKAAWSNLGPLFGFWKIPKADRAASTTVGVENNAKLSWKSTTVFVKCLYPPACLGAPNRALEGRFISEDHVDLAMVGWNHRHQAINNASSSMCATALGFRNQSRLCHSCNATSRRLGTNRCFKCPDAGQNWGLMVLGFFVALFVLCFLVGGAIADAGRQALSSTVQKIFLNYLQIASLSLAFPLHWPPALETLFQFQGAVSTVGETLINPDCVIASSSAAARFYYKQVGFAAVPFIAVVVSFAFWLVYGIVKKTPFFAKRRQRVGDEEEIPQTPKDKFVVTVTYLLYLIFPTLCAQAFRIFDCKTVAGVQYLAIDLEHPCFTGDHLIAVLTLGVGQLAVYVLGLPLLILFFLRRNRRARGGLKRHVVQVRYGLFYSAFKEEKYFWEIVLASRKISIVAISVFGRSIGTQRQAQLALFILFISITLEIIGNPYRAVTERHKIAGRLELASLFSLWGTMWCGTLIFASQAPEERGFVTFLSIMVATVNVSTMLWLVLRLLSECAFEKKKESKLCTAVLKSVLNLCKMASWKATTETKATAITGENAIELATSSPNPMHGATIEVTNATVSHSDDGWIRHFDESSSRYFLYNGATGESMWEEGENAAETATVASAGADEDVEHKFNSWDGWVRHFDASSSKYYQHNPATGQTEWETTSCV